MIWLEDINHMIFISSPRISSLTELMEMNVFLSDIPLYDVTRELVLLNQQRIAEIDVAYVFFYTNVGHISSLVYVIFILSRKKPFPLYIQAGLTNMLCCLISVKFY